MPDFGQDQRHHEQPRDDVMLGAPDNFPLKRAAPTTVEELRADQARGYVDVAAESSTGALAWVGVHNGQIVADWTFRDGANVDMLNAIGSQARDKNEQPDQEWEEQLEDKEWTFYPSDKDEAITATIGGPGGVDHGGEGS